MENTLQFPLLRHLLCLFIDFSITFEPKAVELDKQLGPGLACDLQRGQVTHCPNVLSTPLQYLTRFLV